MRQQRGFTLLEILVAVFITSMLALGVWQLMNTLLAARDGVDRVSGEFQRVQRAVTLFERDVFQALNRSVRDGFGDRRPALSSRISDSDLRLTRQGWRNPLGERRSELQRVAWEYDELDQVLTRRYWVVLDRAQDSEAREQTLLEDLESVEFRFMGEGDNWIDDWPEDEQAGAQDDEALAQGLPRAVEMTIEHERFGVIRRVVDLGGFDPQAIPQEMPEDGAGDEGDAGEPEEGIQP